jgi:uncharacterized protein with HEPN domain
LKSDAVYLKHILEMVRRVAENTSGGREVFLTSHLHQDAVLRNRHTMTETTQRLSTDLKSRYPAIEWTRLAAFRNVLVHDYLGLDLDLVWSVVQNDVPEFGAAVRMILEDLGDSTS